MPTLNWIGKDKVINHHQEVPFRVLEHKYGYSDGIETSEETNSGNLIIHGDNLEALKSLLPKYQGKVNCIYIDPPYNTGNEKWVYNDNVNDVKIKKWLGEVVGQQGEDLSRHDKWLCMMYPRLTLLRKLLANDGVIFISIGDDECANLKLLCDEIFGGNNFVGKITRRQSSGAKNDTGANKVISTADYIMCYSKGDFSFLPYFVENKKAFTKKDEIGYFSTRALEMQGGGDTLTARPRMGYSIYHREKDNSVKLLFDYDLKNQQVYLEPNEELIQQGYVCYRPRKRDMALGIWRWGDGTFMEKFKSNLVYFEKGRVFIKERATETIEKYPESILDDFLNTQGTNELKMIFGEKKFDFPKPSALIERLLEVSSNQDSIILDSFAGSGTTAHAVLNLNKKDGGNRKFILIELEDYADTVTSERVKRVINGYGKDEKYVNGTGGAFDYYELGDKLFLEDGNINEDLSEDKIREYIFFSETNNATIAKRTDDNKYFLGEVFNTSYYFYYEKDKKTTLTHDTLRQIVKKKAEQYVIYADTCTLTEDEMNSLSVVYKKIPRDIKRF